MQSVLFNVPHAVQPRCNFTVSTRNPAATLRALDRLQLRGAWAETAILNIRGIVDEAASCAQADSDFPNFRTVSEDASQQASRGLTQPRWMH